MSEKEEVFFAKSIDPKMIEAYKKAQETFKYFWRELSWEQRRIVPALEVACVKAPFMQEVENSDEPKVEHMWIKDVYFDGENVYGALANTPIELTNIANGDSVEFPLNQISDWLFASERKTYGGFTIHAMRSEMSEEELKAHDEAWNLDFGDYNDILVVREQKEKPENLTEHPMSLNMKDSLITFVKENPEEVESVDEWGYSFLHRETIAGNLTSVEILLANGADASLKTDAGKTALDFAKELKWDHIIPILEKQ